MVSIYPQLNTKINSILSNVTEIQDIYAYPASSIDKYPAAIYYPSSLENDFDSTGDNFKVYGYKLWIVVNAQGTTVGNVFSSVMPAVMDSVLAEIDKEWSFDNIDGHRVWGKVDTGLWTVSEEQAGIEVAAEIDLSVKMLTTT